VEEEIKDVNKKVDEMESAVKKYASKDTVISIGGYEFTPAKLMVAFTIVSSTLGGLYGAFEIRRIENVVENLERSSKTDQRSTDTTVKDIKKEVDNSMKEMKKDVDATLKEVRRYSDQTIKEMNSEMVRNQKENTAEVRALRREVDDKIKKALDNPLSNQ